MITNNKLRECKELKSIKLPRSITQLPTSRFETSGKRIIETYLWKLLRRAYIFTCIIIHKFIQLPIIMEQKTNLLSQQLQTIVREDGSIKYAQSTPSDKDKYILIKCMLYSGYIMEGYKISNINNELNEGFNIQNEYEFRIDLVQIKRVIRYQKEYRFAVELTNGQIHLFKCESQQQFNQWVNDIKNMIKAQGMMHITSLSPLSSLYSYI